MVLSVQGVLLSRLCNSIYELCVCVGREHLRVFVCLCLRGGAQVSLHLESQRSVLGVCISLSLFTILFEIAPLTEFGAHHFG